MNEGDYAITLQDIDGITISGTNYKINSGNKIAIDATSFDLDMSPNVTIRNRNNKEYTSTMAYTTLISEHTFSGINNLKINIKGIMWIDEAEAPRNKNGSPLTIKLLNDMRVYGHKLYLKDYHGTDTNNVSPIYSLCNDADMLGKYVGSSTNGLSVIIDKISSIKRGNDDERGAFITYNLDLEEEK
jgi:hypothetical protein